MPVPDGLDLRAAALIMVLSTAYGLIHEAARLRPGESILVHSAAGGVGTVARLAGAAAVYGVVSRPDKADHARAHGYGEVYLERDFEAQVRRASGGRGVDVFLDPVGGDIWRRSLGTLALFGRAISFGNASGADPWTADMAQWAPRALSVHGFSILSLGTAAPRRLRALTEAALRRGHAGWRNRADHRRVSLGAGGGGPPADRQPRQHR